ncbi:MAG: Ig-like domain-containing protein [Deltaproteobacteria bacterium]|nr:Ig-like domain-containing protein [Deltaproteobacteria bacterium]
MSHASLTEWLFVGDPPGRPVPESEPRASARGRARRPSRALAPKGLGGSAAEQGAVRLCSTALLALFIPACSPPDDATAAGDARDRSEAGADESGIDTPEGEGDGADAPADLPADLPADVPAEAVEAEAEAEADAEAPDDAGDEGTDAACPVVPPPAPVSPLPIPGESPFGRHEPTTADGFEDEYLYDATDYLKIGVRRGWGGSIVFFGLAGSTGPGTNPTNTIDANDTGREVQVAFYDPDRLMQNCAWNASCRTTPSACPSSITYLGWDPVQGGNRCNVGSGVDSVDFTDGALRVLTTPLFWNPDWDRTDCDSSGCSDPGRRSRRSDTRVTQTLRFVATHVVQLEYAVENLAATDHAATAQEMPTMYTANGNGGPDLWRVFDSEGRQVLVDTPAGGDGFFYEDFDSPGGWVAMQDDGSTYGVGIYYENRLTTFQAWQLRSLPFNNVRARFSFGIPASAVVRARAYLVLGSYATIAGQVAWLDARLAPFGSLDAPAADAAVSGTVPVSGWALDNKGVTSVELVIDGAATVPLAYGASRPDVCRVWPGYAGCDAVGFSGTLDASLLTPCGHLVEVRATDADGNVRVIAAARVFAGS